MTPTGPVRARLAQVRLLATDVDGVMTDGTLYYGERGEALVTFHVRDGLGIQLLRSSGVELAVVTGRGSPALDRRLQELDVRHYHPGQRDKAAVVEALMATLGLSAAQVAFVGDDLLDLPAMRRVGVGIAVADAHPLVRAEAHWVTETAGGRGALREIADAILESRGETARAVERLLGREEAR